MEAVITKAVMTAMVLGQIGLEEASIIIFQECLTTDGDAGVRRGHCAHVGVALKS